MTSEAPLGHEVVGTGARRIVVLNDWFSDTSTWDGARRYLDHARFTWAFADLRGYGRSRGRRGTFTVVEAAADVLDLVDALGWSELSIVGHSMSTLVALHVAQSHPARIRRVVLLTPPPPRGFGVDDAWLEATQRTVRDDSARAAMARARFGARYGGGWAEVKTARWLATSDAEAVAAYAAMFARDGLPDPEKRVAAPTLVITGDEDDPLLRREAADKNLSPICASLEVTALPGCGHYPMEEAPPSTVSLVERFLA